MRTEPETSAAEALAQLRAGNKRFFTNTRSVAALSSQLDRVAHAAGQRPFATILTCSDSRLPTELIFDRGIGDLFVIRVAGNVVAPSIVGSVEFAAATFGTRLAVVMGHSDCGAVKATLEVVRAQTEVISDNLRDIVDRIRPAVESVLRGNGRAEGRAEGAPGPDSPALIDAAIRSNVRSSVEHLRHDSGVLQAMVRTGTVVVVGAQYDLVSGRVDFFDLPPELAAAADRPKPQPSA
jgi:carbonic anhydrase